MTSRGPQPDGSGAALSELFFRDVVAPLLSREMPGLPYAAGRLGTGSDVLGFDDPVSRDHDWGLRLSLFVPEDAIRTVCEAVDRGLPERFLDRPTRSIFTGETAEQHHVQISTVHEFAIHHLGFDPRPALSVRQWLSLTGQAVLEITAGPVFADPAGELGLLRSLLAWYPDDVWRHVLSADWIKIAQELPLAGRAADVGDELGSHIIGARIVHTIMHLAFLLERRWAPLREMVRHSVPRTRHRGGNPT